MPSVAGVAHAGSGLGAFSTWTRHMRQLAAIDSLRCQQKCGTKMPSFAAASITVLPPGTSTDLPSMSSVGMGVGRVA